MSRVGDDKALGKSLKASDAPRQLLNPYQKNALRISLVLVEKGVFELDHLLSRGDHHGILFEIQNDLAEEAKSGIRQLIHEIREILREMKDRFQLDLEIDKNSRAIFGKAPLLWEIVTGTDARRLRGYGEIDPGLKDLLDPSIEQLSQLLLSVHDWISKNDGKFVRNRLQGR